MEVHVNNYIIQMVGSSLNITHNGKHGEFTRVVKNIREAVSLFVYCVMSGSDDVGFAIIENATAFVKPYEFMHIDGENMFYHITAESEILNAIKSYTGVILYIIN